MTNPKSNLHLIGKEIALINKTPDGSTISGEECIPYQGHIHKWEKWYRVRKDGSPGKLILKCKCGETA